mgnify:CR=1 FL=1
MSALDEQTAKPYTAAAPAAVASTPGERETREPIKGVRKMMATAMSQSAFTSPHVTEWITVDVTKTMRLVEKLRAAGFSVPRLDLGGGLGISYDEDAPAPPAVDEGLEVQHRVVAVQHHLRVEPGVQVAGVPRHPQARLVGHPGRRAGPDRGLPPHPAAAGHAARQHHRRVLAGALHAVPAGARAGAPGRGRRGPRSPGAPRRGRARRSTAPTACGGSIARTIGRSTATCSRYC